MSKGRTTVWRGCGVFLLVSFSYVDTGGGAYMLMKTSWDGWEGIKELIEEIIYIISAKGG
jgi:hypothetical protein